MLEPIGKILNITKGRGFLKNDIWKSFFDILKSLMYNKII